MATSYKVDSRLLKCGASVIRPYQLYIPHEFTETAKYISPEPLSVKIALFLLPVYSSLYTKTDDRQTNDGSSLPTLCISI